MKIVTFLTFLSLFLTVQAQSLSEQLGAIKTKFEFTTSSSPLEVSQQLIIKSAGMYYNHGAESAYGAGYETFRLEIEVANDLPLLRSKLFDGNGGYHMTFYDENGQQIGFVRFHSTGILRLRKVNDFQEPFHYYSFDLRGVTLSILDKTHRIDIERYIQ